MADVVSAGFVVSVQAGHVDAGLVVLRPRGER
jgi:hypothetical protein